MGICYKILMRRNFMKKIFCFLAAFVFLTGCSCENGKLLNTPTKKVEMFLANYQTLDADVLKQLDDVIDREDTFNDTQKDKYRDIMKKHYENLTYEIKDEKIDGDTATVTAEIEVTDYSKIMKDAEQYKKDHEEEFYNNEEYDESLFIDYRLEQLKEAKEKVKYTIDFTLTKIEDEWKLDALTQEQENKIHGLYQY